MNNELMPYATGEVTPHKGDRRIAKRAKAIYDEVREKDMMARGAFALGADIMDQTTKLYHHGKQLSADDPALGRILAEELVDTVNQARRIQNSLYKSDGYGWFG